MALLPWYFFQSLIVSLEVKISFLLEIPSFRCPCLRFCVLEHSFLESPCGSFLEHSFSWRSLVFVVCVFDPPFLCRKGLIRERRTFLPGKSCLGRSHRDSRYVWKVMEGSSIYKKQDSFILALPWTLPRALAPARPYGLASDEC